MERSIEKNGLINLLLLLVVAAAGFAVARYANSMAGQVSILFIGLGVLVAAVSWFQMRLEESERLEKLELDELARSKAGSALFQSKDAEIFPAQRAREQFERFFVPGFTVLLFLIQAGGAYLLWRWVSQSSTTMGLKHPTIALALFALFALILFLLGKFSATIARLENHRLLRPGSSFLLLGAYLSFIVAAGIIGVEVGFREADYYVARVLCVLLGLIAAETLINLILEIYRPRLRGKVARPLYESRLVGLLGQPEGLITTAAQALDYQFGFKVSDTWFYRFLEKALAWLLLLQLSVLFFSTAIVFIDPGEQALLERFGRPVENRELLAPGGHLKWPWPIDRVYRYRTDQIQTFTIGMKPDPRHEQQDTMLWSVAHSDEENFLVANRDQAWLESTNGVGKRTPPVSLLAVSIPVHYQIHDLKAWAYNNEDAADLLEKIAAREVVRYLVNADFSDVMSHARGEAGRALQERIQAAANERQLGAKIIFAALQDIHPPVKVAPEFEKVVAAIHTKHARILAAEADAIRTNAMAEAQAFTILREAEAERQRLEVGALANAALFTNQIPAFLAAPDVYAQRAYLQTFTRAVSGARKYLLLTTNTQDVITFDLQDRIREDLLGITAPAPRK
jgi:modulator of FtsH protease HflK